MSYALSLHIKNNIKRDSQKKEEKIKQFSVRINFEARTHIRTIRKVESSLP